MRPGRGGIEVGMRGLLLSCAMPYVVIARKYRPATFDEVIGQEAIATTLKNAIRSDRVAHAYLFAGPRGVGKTSMARILAKALNCVHGPTDAPCNKCPICNAVSGGNDIDVLEIDGASNNRVDEIRELRQNVKYTPNRARYKIYIIDEVHMLSTGAFNALLKTLEEPPPHVKFIFATTEPRKVPETIQSRCQRFDFKRVTTADIVARLAQICAAEKIEVEPEVLETIARSVRGGMRDSQSILDQLAAFSDGSIKLADVHVVLGLVPEEQIARLIDDFIGGNVGDALGMVDELFAQGHDVGEFLGQIISYLRDLMVANSCGSDSGLIDRSDESCSRIGEQAQKLSMDTWMYVLQVLSEVKRRARENVQSRVLLEMAVMKLARLEDLRPLSEIVQRLQALEERAESGQPPPGAAPAANAERARPTGRQAPRDTAAASARTKAQEPAQPRPEPSRDEASDRPATPQGSTPAAQHDKNVEPQAPAARPPSELAGLWPEVADRVKQHKRVLGEILSSQSRLGEVGEGRVTVYLASNGHVPLFDGREDRKVVEDAIEAVLGQRLQVEVSVDPEAGSSPEGTSPSASKPNRKPASDAAIFDNPVVKEAIKRFKGRVKGVDR